MSIIKKIRLGDDVVTYCGRCREERTHQVVALKSDGSIERVACRTCDGSRLYRDRQKRATVKTTAKPKQIETPVDAVGPVRLYSPGEIYAPGEQINHPKFGPGKVVESRNGKIDVKFNGELRTLVHAG
jgi:DNA-directed RNA polymerase subunit RPC12/RpoP